MTDDLRVYNNATLTIEPGVTVLVGPNLTIQAGSSSNWGHIVADGVTFERLYTDFSWNGLDCASHSSSSMELTNCTVDGTTHGLGLYMGTVTLDGCTFTGNEWPFFSCARFCYTLRAFRLPASERAERKDISPRCLRLKTNEVSP